MRFIEKMRPGILAVGVCFGLAASVQKTCSDELIVQMKTGGDDLRGGNDNVHVELMLRSGEAITFENVNGLRRWADNSEHTITRRFRDGLRREDIVGLKVQTTFGGGIAGDNWNLDRLRVSVSLNGVVHQILDEQGRPLVRFTGNNRERSFTFPPDPDRDGDGLPDDYERAEAASGLSDRRSNLIFVPVLRPNKVTREEAEPMVQKVVEFFARIPNRNLDGSTGIGVVVRWGNTLAPIHSGAPGRGPTEYQLLRTLGMPADMIGKAHGVLIDSGGGGQTSHSDWSTAGNHWATIAHELGHQLGLDHEPKGSRIPSPLYASIMNYDYNFSFNGSADRVQFSTGRFRSVSLNEADLSETLPFQQPALEFLRYAPNSYRLRSAGGSSTHVDFNRNGVFGEVGLRSDINGGSGVTPRERVDFTQTAGGFALASLGERLVAVLSDVPRADWPNYTSPGLSVTNPGRLRYQIYSDGRLRSPEMLISRGVTGDPHAVAAFGRLLVTYPTARGYVVAAYIPGTVEGTLRAVGRPFVESDAPGAHPVLIRTTSPEAIHLFVWNERNSNILSRRVLVSTSSSPVTLGPANEIRSVSAGGSRPFLSNSPIGATWNPILGRPALVITTAEAGFHGRMRLVTLAAESGSWSVESNIPVEGTTGGAAATLSKPSVIFDDRPSAGRHGQYMIFSRWEGTGTEAAPNEVLKMTRDERNQPVWTGQLMQNIWTITRSAPAATLHQDEVAWGWRVGESFPSIGNRLEVYMRASGATDTGLTDFDDVTWIVTRGLRESLGR